MNMKVINGENLVLGRLASYVAKAALLGEQISIVNCDKVMITGNKHATIYHQKDISTKRGKPNRGRFYEKRPDFFVQKAICHMLPKNARGISAYKKIKCYVNPPLQFKSFETLSDANISKSSNVKYMSVGEVCKIMGGK